MNSPLLRTGIVLAALMFAASALAVVLRPSLPDPSKQPRVHLADKVPIEFGQWQSIDRSSLIVNPEQTEVLDRIYSDVLSRSYRHAETGTIVMLSIAYGAIQNKQSQVHRPDVCYPAQGFKILQSQGGQMETPHGHIPVRRLVTQMGGRTEPLTYWIRVGDRVTQGWVGQKLAVVLEGAAGRVADGLIFRVSSIDQDPSRAFSTQDAFVNDLLLAIEPRNRAFLLGATSVSQ